MPSLSNPGKRIAVIGGGIVGASCALALSAAGHRVTLIESDRAGRGASWGNAGHIAIEQVEPLASPGSLRSVFRRLLDPDGALSLPLAASPAWLPFAVRMARASTPRRFAKGTVALTALLDQAMPAWRRLAASLDDSDIVREDGHYIAWDAHESGAKGRSAWLRKGRAAASFRDLTAAEWTELEGVTGCRPASALRCIGSGQISDHARLFAALDRALERRDVVRLWGEARLTRAMTGQVSVIVEDEPDFSPDLAVLAAGVASRGLIEHAGHHAPMVAERGYHVEAQAGRWPAAMAPIVFEDRSMIVTRFANTVRASSFIEFAAPDRPPDARKWDRLRGRIADLGLPFDLPGTEWMGARPTLPDYLPAIGRSDRWPNLLYAFGHQHLGLTLAPLTAEIIAALADDRRPSIDTTAFDLRRFD